MKKTTYSNIGKNASALNAGANLCIEDRKNAEHHDNIPHNAFSIANQDATCTVYIFLDNFADATKPDYVLFPSQQITVNLDDGVSFTHIFLKNTHASSNISAGNITYKIQTIKDVTPTAKGWGGR